MSMFVGLSTHAVAANTKQRLNLFVISDHIFSRTDQSLLTLRARKSPFQDARTLDFHLPVDRCRPVSLYR